MSEQKRFHRKFNKPVPEGFYDDDIDMQIIEWWCQDEEGDDADVSEGSGQDASDIINDVYTMRCFGVTKNGVSVTCKITGFQPFYYIKVPQDFNRLKLHNFLKYIESSYALKKYPNALVKDKSGFVLKKDLFGFKNGKMFKFVKLVFNSVVALNKSKYLFKKPVSIQNVTTKPTKFKLYESNFEPFMRYCHIKDIYMAGWIRLPKGKYRVTEDTASTQTEVVIDRKDIISLKDKQDMAKFLQASWDIEVYSHDYSFPNPKTSVKDPRTGKVSYPNEIYQIGTTYKYYGDDEILFKHLLTLKKCAKIDDPRVIVEECQNERELIRKWVDTISDMDPDIFYTYNGDSFDCMYLVERAELCGLVNSRIVGNKTVKDGYLLQKLSRMANKSAEIKKEYFSSSAYGDSEFNRVYIPGRLNYDLMIHYKRGMKKYDSYKLDHIAGAVLKEGKHEVTARDIFQYYEDGHPDKIRVIGEYCFVEGTRVSLPSCSVDIKCLEHMNTDVITWYENKGFSTSQKTHFFNNGVRDCIQLTLLDGTQIRCTHDHKFLTKNGWIEAQNLKSTDKILFYPEPAYVDYDTENSYTCTFSDLIGTLDYEKSCILLRLLGYLFTDGGISESTCYKNYSAGRVKYMYDVSYINIGTMADAISMQKDICTLIGKSPAISKTKYTYRITLPQELTKWILSIDCVQKGRKLSSTINLPRFILNENCEKWVLREFLKGLMGGDGQCPSFSKATNKIGSLGFGQSKTFDNIDSLINYMTNIKKMFEKFDIQSTLSKVRKNAKGDGYTVKLQIKQDDIIKFYEKIGFAYCAGKSYKLAVISSYYRLKRETKRQFNWVCERVKVLRDNMSIPKALKQAHTELKINEPIYNQHYSLPNVDSINLELDNPSNVSASYCKFRKKHFPSIHDYLKLTESYDRFVTDGNKKSYSVKQNETHTPCFYLSVLEKKDIGKHNVYDIEVSNTHNFIANGAVVHNCIQDTHLLQKLVDKQLILTNIVQLANVTYVPIGYLTTRGQTIKVYSQLLRKARQMDFLVPHINFNEDINGINIKLKDPHNFTEEDINEYVEIDCGKSQVQSMRTRSFVISGKLSEIVDEHNIVILSDFELQNEFYNVKLRYKRRETIATRVWPCDDAVETSFTGATVLEPKCGLYTDNIAVLDFASLYPTIMISRNLCYSTFVMDDKYKNIEGVKYETIAWDDKIDVKLRHTCEAIGKSGKSKGQVCGKQAFFNVDDSYFCRIHDPIKKTRGASEKYQKRDVSYSYTIVQPHIDEDGNVVNKGVLPALLEELYEERKKVKKQMVKAQQDGDKLLTGILDSTQLAIKVSLNSCYGFLGRCQGNLILKELGSIVTSVGRMLIDQSKEYAEGDFMEYIKDKQLVTHTVGKLDFNMSKEEKATLLSKFCST